MEQILKWDPEFLDGGLTMPMLQSILKNIYRDHPDGRVDRRMPALSKLRVSELRELCVQNGIPHSPKDTTGELQLKLRQFYQSRTDPESTPQDSVTFGKKKGLTYQDVLEDSGYAEWVVNTANVHSHREFKKLVFFLRRNGVLPTEAAPETMSEDDLEFAQPQPRPSRGIPASSSGQSSSSRRQRRGKTMADDSQPPPQPAENTEMQQLLSMMQGLHTGMENINARLTQVEQQRTETEASFQLEPNGGPHQG